MNRNEDYLDNLLTSVTDKLNEFDDDFEQSRESLKKSYQTQSDLPPKTQSALDEIREDNFLQEFNDDMQSGMTEEDFIREFEQELNGEADSLYDTPHTDDYVSQIDQVMNQAAADDTGTLPGMDDLPENDPFLEDMFREDQTESVLADIFQDDMQESAPAEQLSADAFSQDEQAEPSFDNTFSQDVQAEPSPDELLQEDSQTISIPENIPENIPEGMSDNLQDSSFEEDSRPLSMPEDIPAVSDEPEDVFQGGRKEMPSMPDMPDMSDVPDVPEGMEGLEDIFGSEPAGDTAGGSASQEEIDRMLQQGAQSGSMSQPAGNEGSSLDQILNESDDDEIAQMGKLLNTEENGENSPFTEEPDFAYNEAAAGAGEDTGSRKKKGKKEGKEKNPNRIWARLSRILFGTPEELNPELAAQIAAANGGSKEEDLDPKALKEKKKQEKELKKQEKKEAAEQKKQEKEAAKAEKAAQKAAKKASKPKKEKKPKPKLPKEPPLPKVPVIMMWTIALSVMVLVFLGTSLTGYSVPLSESKKAFDDGDYVLAYAKLQGVKVKKADEDLYRSAEVLAGVQTELEAYTALMEQKQYEMALDSLIRGAGRCRLHAAEAEEWGVLEQLKEIENELNQLLKEQFDVSKRRARKLYAIKKRNDYTLELHKILEKLGLYQ